MKVKLVARQQIINDFTGNIHDDFGLKALDGYYESDCIEVPETFSEVEVIDLLRASIESMYNLDGEWEFTLEKQKDRGF